MTKLIYTDRDNTPEVQLNDAIRYNEEKFIIIQMPNTQGDTIKIQRPGSNFAAMDFDPSALGMGWVA
jgi:hypothetical protein